MSHPQPPSAPPPGWYPDGPGRERRWDGSRWTDERRSVAPEPPHQHTVQRPVPPPGQVPSPHDLPTVKPGEWPAQPAPQQPAQPVQPAPPTYVAPAVQPPQQPPAQQPAQQQPVWPTAAAPSYAPPGAAPQPGWAPQPGFPPPGFPPPPKKSLAWLWVVLALVLVVALGSTAALVVVRPWEDDTTATDSDRDDEASEDQADDGEAPAPTGEPDATESAPSAPDAVTGDIDGDGLGDAVAVFRDRAEDPTIRFTFTSTGSGFDQQREELDSFEDRVWIDADQDGTLEGLTWSYDTGNTLTVDSDLTGQQQFTVRLIDDAPYVGLETGDFDGDGATDLLAYGETERHQVTAWVLHNNGDGFDEPAEWFVQAGATFFDVGFHPGDFTGDGRADVAARLPSGRLAPKDDYYDGEYGVALLESTGSSFDAGSLEKLSDDPYVSTAVVGDFLGDGVPRVAVLGVNGGVLSAQLYEWDGAAFVPLPGSEGELSRSGTGYVTAELASDVDGDGLDDLVYTFKSTEDNQLDGVRVARADGTGFGAGELWADLPRCQDEYCFTYFQGS